MADLVISRMPMRKDRFVNRVRILAVRWDGLVGTDDALQIVKAADSLGVGVVPYPPEQAAVVWVAYFVGLLPSPEPWMMSNSDTGFRHR
jgi:hypothetical protein